MLGITIASIHAHLRPDLASPTALRGGVVVVIDQLRASTTITAALAAGARGVIPCGTVEHARAVRDRLVGTPVLLGGERGGIRIPGFDLGNSPLEYTPLSVLGRTVGFTTTNGTAALERAVHAGAIRVMIGCLANAAAVVRALSGEHRPIHLLCAGTRGESSLEDCLTAGAIGELLLVAGHHWAEQDEGRLMAAAWREASVSASRLLHALRDARGGRDLLKLGFDADVEFCARVGVWEEVPEWHASAPGLPDGLGVLLPARSESAIDQPAAGTGRVQTA